MDFYILHRTFCRIYVYLYTLFTIVVYMIFNPFDVWLFSSSLTNPLSEGSRFTDNGSIPCNAFVRDICFENTSLFQTANHISLYLVCLFFPVVGYLLAEFRPHQRFSKCISPLVVVLRVDTEIPEPLALQHLFDMEIRRKQLGILQRLQTIICPHQILTQFWLKSHHVLMNHLQLHVVLIERYALLFGKLLKAM